MHFQSFESHLSIFHEFQSFFIDELQTQLYNTGVTPKGCVVRLDEQASTYVRVSCTFPGKPSQREYVHRLVYMLEHRRSSLPLHLEVSHLCHTPRCVRIDHLTLETKEMNQSRIHCKNQGFCSRNHLPLCI